MGRREKIVIWYLDFLGMEERKTDLAELPLRLSAISKVIPLNEKFRIHHGQTPED